MSLRTPEGFRWQLGVALAALLFASFLAPVAAQTSVGTQVEDSRLSGSAVDAGAEGDLSARYWIEADDDGIELTPRQRDSAVESIRLEDGEDEALVNGKSFTRQELRAFLGADGERIAELLRLSDETRRQRLGILPESTEPDGEGRESGEREASADDASHWVPRPPSPPRPPRVFVEGRNDDRVSFGQTIEIGPDESVGDAVCIGCSVIVEGTLHRGAVAVGGRVEVRSGGTVDQDVVAVGGSVVVESGGTVNGDAVSVGAGVRVDDGGEVNGQRSSVGWGSGFLGGGRHGFLPFDFSGNFADLFWSLLRAFMLALLAAIAVLFLRRPIDRTSRRLLEEPWKAVFAGLLTQLLFFPVLVVVTVILAVSVIGIPLLILVPVAVLAFVVAMVVGYVAVARSLGRWAKERFGWNLSEPFMTVVAGVVLLQGTTILARIISLPGGVVGMVGFALLCLGFFLKYMGWTIGLGAMVLSVLAKDWRRALPEPESDSGAAGTTGSSPRTGAPAADRGNPIHAEEGVRTWAERAADLEDVNPQADAAEESTDPGTVGDVSRSDPPEEKR